MIKESTSNKSNKIKSHGTLIYLFIFSNKLVEISIETFGRNTEKLTTTETKRNIY